MKVLMLTKSHYAWDVRVRREAEALASAGHQVTVIGLGADLATDTGIRVLGIGDASGSGRSRNRRRAPWFRVGRWLFLPEHRARAVSRFQDQVEQVALELPEPVDVVHAHDFPALKPAVDLASRFSSRLVYDAHEYWAGRPRRGRHEPLRKRRNRHVEARLASLADVVIMVSPSGAELLSEALGLEDVRVIRNTFPVRSDLEPPTAPSGALYAGRIAPRRDLDTVFAATVWRTREGFDLHLIGEVDDVSIPGFAVTHPQGTMDTVDRLLAKVGIGLVTMTRGPINHRIALPNKLFQSISAGVPVVAADLPQTASVVEEHGLGRLYTPGNPASFSAAVESVIADYGALVGNVRRARPLFDWAVDAKHLVDIYRTLDGRN